MATTAWGSPFASSAPKPEDSAEAPHTVKTEDLDYDVAANALREATAQLVNVLLGIVGSREPTLNFSVDTHDAGLFLFMLGAALQKFSLDLAEHQGIVLTDSAQATFRETAETVLHDVEVVVGLQLLLAKSGVDASFVHTASDEACAGCIKQSTCDKYAQLQRDNSKS